MKLILNKPDTLGIIASTLCMIHCLVTPLLFITQTSIATNEVASIWWKNIDFLLLVISFFAVYRSTQKSSNDLIKYGLWITFISLTIIILNEKMKWFFLPESIIHIAGLTLVTLHIYNLNYCQCKDKNCCTNYE